MNPQVGNSQNTSNYLIPSSGGTHAVPFAGVFSAVPYPINWRQFTIDQFPFQPQGVFIDNTAGAGPLIISIAPIGWQVTCPAGAQIQAQFPAPMDQSTQITGDGQATVVFVDFPVLPGAGAVTIVGGSVGISGQPIATAPAANSAGIPYQNTEVPAATAAFFNDAITGASKTSGNIGPAAANQNLRKLLLRLTGNASLAAAGLEVITATLNGIVIWRGSVYLPAAAGTEAEVWRDELDFSKLGLNYGAAGSLVVTVSTALATGALEINAYTA